MYLKNRDLRNFEVYRKPAKEKLAASHLAVLKLETMIKIINEEFKLEYDRELVSSMQCEEGNVSKISIVCPFYDDIYTLEQYLTNHTQLITKEDYIQSPKENGYRALHLLFDVPIYLHKNNQYIKVEICLQTTAMHYQTMYTTMR